MSCATSARAVGPAAAAPKPDGPASTVLAEKLDSVKDNAGVVDAVATLVVNSGDNVPALKLVTVPLAPAAVQSSAPVELLAAQVMPETQFNLKYFR